MATKTRNEYQYVVTGQFGALSLGEANVLWNVGNSATVFPNYHRAKRAAKRTEVYAKVHGYTNPVWTNHNIYRLTPAA